MNFYNPFARIFQDLNDEDLDRWGQRYKTSGSTMPQLRKFISRKEYIASLRDGFIITQVYLDLGIRIKLIEKQDTPILPWSIWKPIPTIARIRFRTKEDRVLYQMKYL